MPLLPGSPLRRAGGARRRTVDSLKRALTWPARWPHTTPALRVLAKPRRKRHLAQRERSHDSQTEEIQSAGAASADASGNPRHRARHHAGDVSRRARPDHRRHRAADHRPAFFRSRRPVLGGHRLSAHRHRGDAALRQTVRHLRPAHDDADRHRHLHRRFDGLRAGAEHDRTDRLAARCRGWAAAG